MVVLGRHAGAARFAFNQCLAMVKDALDTKAKTADGSVRVPWTAFDLINSFNGWKRSAAAGRVWAVDSAGQATLQSTGLRWRSEVSQQVFEKDRLSALFADDHHVEVEATWGIYQRMIAAYREPDRAKGRELMVKLIGSVSAGVPKALTEIITLGRTLKKRGADVLAYFDRPGTSNGPTEAINGRLEHLRGSALGFRNLTNYIARSLLESGGFRPQLHPRVG
ncbi:hypothetical protein HDA40_007803 [Hamadaea flava]|nr:hypothetical protein [Hamadaea flava]